jgi:hypothetical protein
MLVDPGLTGLFLPKDAIRASPNHSTHWT